MTISSSDAAGRPPLPAWRHYLQQGGDYLGSLRRDVVGRRRFSGDLAFDLASLAVEHFLFALCLAHGQIPSHGCLVALAGEAAALAPISAAAKREVDRLVAMKDICSLLPTAGTPVEAAEIPTLLAIATTVEAEVAHLLTST